MKNPTSLKIASIALVSVFLLSVNDVSAQKKKNKKKVSTTVKKDKEHLVILVKNSIKEVNNA